MSYLLPNFIMLLDALTNTYLGLCKNNDEDKADPKKEKKKTFLRIISF